MNEHDTGKTGPVGLAYAVPPPRRRHSAFAVAGLTVAVLAAAVPAVVRFLIWRDRFNGGSGSDVAVSIGYFALPATAILLALVALARRSRRSLALAAIILAALASLATLWMNGRRF